jgi:hypothetical protein
MPRKETQSDRKQLSGAINNCYCRSTMPGFTSAGGWWMGFESVLDDRDMFNLSPRWAAAAAGGLLIPVSSFVVAAFWWQKCKPLWAATERGAERVVTRFTNSDWLRP